MRTVVINLYGREYKKSIRKLREELNVGSGIESPRIGVLQLDICLPDDAIVHALMERKSLYIIAIKDLSNQWIYLRGHEPKGTIVSKFSTGGMHKDLGTISENIKVSPHNFEVTNVMMNLSKLSEIAAPYGSNIVLTQNQKMALSFLVVSCAEAARFEAISRSVERLLTGEVKSYKPGEGAEGDYHKLMKEWRSLCGPTQSAKMGDEIRVRYME